MIKAFHSKHPSAPRRLPDGTIFGKPVTKKTRKRKNKLNVLELQPLESLTDVSTWIDGPMTRDASF